jgi:hypothetical protein
VLHSFLIQGEIESMKDIMNLPCHGELELVCHMANRFCNLERSILFGSQLVCGVCSFEILGV